MYTLEFMFQKVSFEVRIWSIQFFTLNKIKQWVHKMNSMPTYIKIKIIHIWICEKFLLLHKIKLLFSFKMLEIIQKRRYSFSRSKKNTALILLHCSLCFHFINGKSTTTFSRQVCASTFDSTETLNHKQLKTLWSVLREKKILASWYVCRDSW